MTPPPFAILYADPPWQFRTLRSFRVLPQGASYHSGRMLPYPSMSTDEIANLAVSELCGPDCVLFLWATYPLVPDALKVLAAWGFAYKTVAFTWVKRTPKDTGFHFGLGYWTRANPEICLLGTKGHPHRVSKSVPNLIISPLRDHSRKPDEVRDRIVRLCGDLPRAELFAREKSPGWQTWGNEVASDFRLHYHTDSRPHPEHLASRRKDDPGHRNACHQAIRKAVIPGAVSKHLRHAGE